MVERIDVEEALRRAAALSAGRPGPAVLGITGPPGAGKSWLAERLVARLDAVAVGMDGFHLAHVALERLGRVARKGAPDTFDAAGYVALLRRVRDLRGPGPHATVWAPQFRREIEDPVAGAVAVSPQTRLVVTEGNYLLLGTAPWDQVRGLLDACWYLDVPDDVRRTRLTARHQHHGRTPAEARERTLGSDERNARLVATTRERADLLVVAGGGGTAGSLD